jgi:hypothetical protein
MEAQLDGADGLPIREKANEIYDKVANAVFGTLSQIAKTDRGDGQAAEDKGQLNYHVIMIGTFLLGDWKRLLMDRKHASLCG